MWLFLETQWFKFMFKKNGCFERNNLYKKIMFPKFLFKSYNILKR